MAVGLSTNNLANKWLNYVRGFQLTTPPQTLWVALHKGDPGALGTSSLSTGAPGRRQLILSAPSGSVAGQSTIALSGAAPNWLVGAADVIQAISVWDSDATSGSLGNFLWSATLTSSRSVVNGDTFTLTACGLTLSPIAA
jgi:hypothetical protein